MPYPPRIERRIPQCGVQVGEPFFVSPGEIAVGPSRIGHENRLITQRATQLLAAGEVVSIEQRSGRCDERDAAAGLEHAGTRNVL
jgi:hypothetical protein